jgi:hypothetical protein
MAGYGEEEGGDPDATHKAEIGQHLDKHVVGSMIRRHHIRIASTAGSVDEAAIWNCR